MTDLPQALQTLFLAGQWLSLDACPWRLVAVRARRR